jgi:hypothetical protein
MKHYVLCSLKTLTLLFVNLETSSIGNLSALQLNILSFPVTTYTRTYSETLILLRGNDSADADKIRRKMQVDKLNSTIHKRPSTLSAANVRHD